MGHPSAGYTYRDYLSTPEDSGDRYEIVDGSLRVSASPRYRHQVVVSNLVGLLGGWVRARGLGGLVPGPITVRLRDDLVVEPDVVFIRRDRMGIVTAEGRIHGAPDLVVEVLSPSNRAYDREVKRERYLANGVPEVWIVDADARTIEVWKAGERAPIVAREVLRWTVGAETFEVALAQVFA